MVLAGFFVVALGSIVDDAIIDVENIVRRLRQQRREGTSASVASIILQASLEIRSAIVYATLIIVLAVTPVFFMGGLSGAFFEPLALSAVGAAGIDGGCPHRYAGALPDPPRTGRDLTRFSVRRHAAERLSGSPLADHPGPPCDFRRVGVGSWPPAPASGRSSDTRCFRRSRSAIF